MTEVVSEVVSEVVTEVVSEVVSERCAPHASAQVSQVHVATATAPSSPGKDKAPSKKPKPLSSPPRIHRTLPSLLIGDLVWARVSSKAQWWPAMVAYDPRLVQYFRHRAADKRLEYHLQWFGKGARRSWVSVALLDPMVSADQHPL